jgi:aminoglycoside phosphotransferase
MPALESDETACKSQEMKSDQGCPPLDARSACTALREAGLDLSPSQIRIEPREDRWLVSLPGERLAWFAANSRGRLRLEIERRVLRLLAERCSFRVPHILFVSDRGWDLRAAVPGICDPWGLYRRTLTDAALARHIGRALGGILVEQHAKVAQKDVIGWLPTRPPWPQSSDWIRRRLPQVIDDPDLLRKIDRALEDYDGLTVEAVDRVLVHGDLGLHNIAVDPGTAEVRGVFDYDGASLADRHHDFRYLLFDHRKDDALEAALEVYEPAFGRTLDRRRIRLYNAACAIGFLAFREGVPPEERSCGRRLAEDVGWVRGALLRL